MQHCNYFFVRLLLICKQIGQIRNKLFLLENMFRKFASNTLDLVRKNVLCGNNLNQPYLSLRRNLAVRKRFYRNVGVLNNDGKFEITLDQRKLKTPKGSLFQVNNELLALTVAAEWDKQKEVIQQSTMHLTGLSSTVLDNPNNLAKFDIVQQLIGYLETDTVLFTSSEQDELYDLQVKEWFPIVEWFSKRYGVSIGTSSDFTGPVISPETKEVLSRHLLSYNFWAVHGYRFAIEGLKSVILGMAAADRHITVEQAVKLSRLEEDYQSGRWGRVEWAHDMNELDSQARVAAGVLFIHTNSASSIVKDKKNADAVR